MRRSTGGSPSSSRIAAIEPGAGLGGARPDPLVEAAEQHEVGRLQPRLELAPDQQPRVARRARPHRARRHRLGEQRGVGGRRDQVIGIARLEQLGAEGSGRLARLARPQRRGRALLVARERLGEGEMRLDQPRQGDLRLVDELLERLRQRPQPLDPARQPVEPLRAQGSSPLGARLAELAEDAGEAAAEAGPAQAGALERARPLAERRRAPRRPAPADA